MLIDLTPYLTIVLAASLGLAGFYFKSITTKLSDLSGNLGELAIKIATLIEHNSNTDGDIIDLKKYHNEIIDLKVATAELNERSLTTRSQVQHIFTRLDETLDRR